MLVRTLHLFFVAIGLLLLQLEGSQAAELAHLEAILQEHCQSVRGRGGSWDCVGFQSSSSDDNDRTLMVMADQFANRMRVMTEIGPFTPGETNLERLLEANFATSLDARYAIRGGFVYAVFLHPLQELEPQSLPAMMDQVDQLANSYGSTYSSGRLQYVGRTHTSTLHKKKKKTPRTPTEMTIKEENKEEPTRGEGSLRKKNTLVMVEKVEEPIVREEEEEEKPNN